MQLRIAVVGGGIAGLAAARELALTGGAGILVELLEAAPGVGGKLVTADFAGHRVDVGPDSFLVRRPEAAALATEVGVGDQLAEPAVSGAFVAAGHRLRPLPEGLVMGLPTRPWPVLRSRTMSWRGVARLALGALRSPLSYRVGLSGKLSGDRDGNSAAATIGSSAVSPGREHGGRAIALQGGDADIGAVLEASLGKEVVQRLADPMIGGIYAGSVYGMSARAVFPPLVEAMRDPLGIVHGLVRQAPPAGRSGSTGGRPPTFNALRGGMATLVDAVEASAAALGCTVRPGSRVVAVQRSGRQWNLTLEVTAPGRGDGTHAANIEERYDALVMAIPAYEVAPLFGPIAPEAASVMAAIPYASVSVVTILADGLFDAELPPGTGYLVPAGMYALDDPARPLVTAGTFLSRKWSHLSGSGDALLRFSAGRHGDDRHLSYGDGDLVERAINEAGALMRTEIVPRETLVTRWERALPQYLVGHLDRVENAARALRSLGPISLAGASFGGIGIPACIKSGREAAASLLAQLDELA